MGKLRSILVASLLAAYVLAAKAQMLTVNAAQQQPNSLAGKDNTAGVYVRDSAIAQEKLALAQRMENLKDWGKSADVYQEILEKYPDRVVPSGLDSSNRIVQYTSVTQAVRQAICKWPVEGLDVYRARFEAPAAKLLSGAGRGDLSVLHNVFSLYFPTESGKTAGLRLMDAYFETGDYAAVADVGRRLLDMHPNLLAERPGVLYRTALAEKLCQDMDEAGKDAESLRRDFPQAVGKIRGVDTPLTASLQQELASGSELVRGAVSDDWSTFGGDESRAKVSTSTVKPGALLYSLPLTPVSWAAMTDATRRHDIEQQDSGQRAQGQGLGVMPVVDHGELFFQDNVSLYAVDLDSGLPLPGWAETYPGRSGAYQLGSGASAVPLGEEMCVTVTNRFVLAVMGLPDRTAIFNGIAAQHETKLVCLDRHTGKEIWTLSAQQLPEAYRQLQMGGAPLVVGDNVYVIGHGSKGQQFEDCYALCIRAETGEFRWASYIASAVSQDAGMANDGTMLVSPNISHIGYASGRIFVTTDLGAVASLDAYTGSVIWLNIYRQTSVTPNLNGGFMMNGQAIPQPEVNNNPWANNAAMVQNGKVFVLPSDGQDVLIYDAATGKEIKRILLSDVRLDDNDDKSPDMLLCVDGDYLYLGSQERVWRFPWRTYVHETNAQPLGYWSSIQFVQQGPASNSTLEVHARPFVTGDAIYVPTPRGLRRVMLKSGMLDQQNNLFPRNDSDSDDSSGNVVVAQDHLIVAGDTHISVYTDLQIAKTKLDGEVAAAPDDPAPRLHYAEIFFAAGQTETALNKLEEAFNLMGGSAIKPGPAGGRAFNDALNFAVRLAEKPRDNAPINRLFDLAMLAAQSAPQQVSYRIERAKFDLAVQKVSDAMGLYQEILGDDVWRHVVMEDPQTKTMSQAAVIVQKAIAKLLESPEGLAAYDPFNEQAKAKFLVAKAAADPAALQALAKSFPNSSVAHDAMMAAADAFEARGDWRQATQVLQQSIGEFSGGKRAIVLESMARNYLKMPGHLDVAVARLTLAASISPLGKLARPLPLPDGTVLQNITFGDARDALLRYTAKASTDALPDLHLPTRKQIEAYKTATGKRLGNPFNPVTAQTTIANVDALLIPLEGFSRNDRLAAWSSAGGLTIYAPTSNTPLATSADVKEAPLGSAWIGDTLLVWTHGSVRLLKGTGQTAWRLDLASLPPVESIGSPVTPAAGQTSHPMPVIQQANVLRLGVAEGIDHIVPVDDRILVSTTGGRILALNSADGIPVWQTRLGDHAIDNLLATLDFTVARFHDDTDIHLVVLDTFNGDLAGRKSFPLQSGQCPVNQALTADGTLVYTTPDQLCVLDLSQVNLSEGGMEPRVATVIAPETAQMFAGSNQEGQLVVHAGRAFAVAEQGRHVRVYSLETAKPWTYHSADANGDIQAILDTNAAGSADPTLCFSGNYLYVLSRPCINAYHFDNPAEKWGSSIPSQPHNFEQVLFGRDYLIAFDHQRPPLTSSSRTNGPVWLCVFSRAPVEKKPTEESGNMDYRFQMKSIDGGTSWQAVEGGVAYFNDGAINILVGARDSVGK